MTNDRLFGIFARIFTVPLILGVVGIGAYALYSFGNQELIAKELYQWEPVPALLYEATLNGTKPGLELTYVYEYGGKRYTSNQISPFPRLNSRAVNNQHFLEWVRREDHPPLTVYLDPSDPTRVSILRGWPQDDRIEAFVVGSSLLTVGLVLLYFSLRKVRKVAELF